MFGKRIGFLQLFLLLTVFPASVFAGTANPAASAYHPPVSRNLLIRLGMRIHRTSLDCSHLVHYLYERAGLHYDYAPSRTLYEGTEDFQRVYDPQPGDLIVWRGHVGIVVDPVEETFLSALRSGVKVSSYTSRYWRRRGTPRFFRYRSPEPQEMPVLQSGILVFSDEDE